MLKKVAEVTELVVRACAGITLGVGDGISNRVSNQIRRMTD